jgi:hypothetical protein
MVVQVVVIILVCLFASSLALIIAGVSLSVFARFLKRADPSEGKQRP